MQDSNAPESLRDFQIGYGRYLRNPKKKELPEGIPARRSEIYEDLLFNNICGFINNCFPVAKYIFDEEQWQEMCRNFFEHWRCSTPIFSQIPFEFVRYISESIEAEKLPDWLSELLHYEWVELEVDLAEVDFDQELIEASEGNATVRANPTMKLLAYNWPVHTLSKTAVPDSPTTTFLVVYRNSKLTVRFLEVNATTYMLLQLIQNEPAERAVLLASFAEQIQHPDAAALETFGLQLIADLIRQEILIGADI